MRDLLFGGVLTFLPIAFLPLTASALTLSEVRETAALFLYGMIGFFGAAAFLLFGGGFTVYMLRLGTEHRVEGIYVMIKGVEVLFGVVCLIGILKLVE